MTMPTIVNFVKENAVKLRFVQLLADPRPAGRQWPHRDPQARHYQVVLERGGNRYATFYTMGSGLTKRPTVEDVLDSLAHDAASADQSFADWCSDFGEDTDSRRARDTYNACAEEAKNLRRLLGDSLYRYLIEEVERL